MRFLTSIMSSSIVQFWIFQHCAVNDLAVCIRQQMFLSKVDYIAGAILLCGIVFCFVPIMRVLCEGLGDPRTPPTQRAEDIVSILFVLMFQLFIVSSIVVVPVTSTGLILSISGLNHNKTTTNIKPPQVLRLGTILQCHSKNRQHLVGARNTCRWETQELPKGR